MPDTPACGQQIFEKGRNAVSGVYCKRPEGHDGWCLPWAAADPQREAAWKAWHHEAIAQWMAGDWSGLSHEAFCAGWDAASTRLRGQLEDATRRHVAEQHLIHDDLAELLNLLGLGDYARPQSPHEVFQMCLGVIRDLLGGTAAPSGGWQYAGTTPRMVSEDGVTFREEEGQ